MQWQKNKTITPKVGGSNPSRDRVVHRDEKAFIIHLTPHPTGQEQPMQDCKGVGISTLFRPGEGNKVTKSRKKTQMGQTNRKRARAKRGYSDCHQRLISPQTGSEPQRSNVFFNVLRHYVASADTKSPTHGSDRVQFCRWRSPPPPAGHRWN